MTAIAKMSLTSFLKSSKSCRGTGSNRKFIHKPPSIHRIPCRMELVSTGSSHPERRAPVFLQTKLHRIYSPRKHTSRFNSAAIVTFRRSPSPPASVLPHSHGTDTAARKGHTRRNLRHGVPASYNGRWQAHREECPICRKIRNDFTDILPGHRKRHVTTRHSATARPTRARMTTEAQKQPKSGGI